MFDELSGGSGGGLEPKKITRAGLEALKVAKVALRTIFTLIVSDGWFTWLRS